MTRIDGATAALWLVVAALVVPVGIYVVPPLLHAVSWVILVLLVAGGMVP